MVVMSGEVGFTTSTRSAASYTPTRAAGLTSARYRLRGDAYRIRSPSITPSSRPWETPWSLARSQPCGQQWPTHRSKRWAVGSRISSNGWNSFACGSKLRRYSYSSTHDKGCRVYATLYTRLCASCIVTRPPHGRCYPSHHITASPPPHARFNCTAPSPQPLLLSKGSLVILGQRFLLHPGVHHGHSPELRA